MYLLQAVTYIRLPFQTRTSICTREQLIKLTFSVCYITDNCAQHEIHVIFSLSLYSYNLLITWNSRGKNLRHVENFFVTWKSFNLFSNKFSFKIHMNALLFVKITCGTVGCCSQYFCMMLYEIPDIECRIRAPILHTMHRSIYMMSIQNYREFLHITKIMVEFLLPNQALHISLIFTCIFLL